MMFKEVKGKKTTIHIFKDSGISIISFDLNVIKQENIYNMWDSSPWRPGLANQELEHCKISTTEYSNLMLSETPKSSKLHNSHPQREAASW